MPRYEVHIQDMTRSIEVPVEPREPTPEFRSVITTVEEPDQDAAIEAAWPTWDAKYGPNARPESARIDVNAV